MRLLIQGWDSGLLSPHPDERQVAFVAERTAGWFADPGFYAYGALHFRAVQLATALIGQPRAYRGLLFGGRTLSLLASLFALGLGFVVARRAWGRRTAALFLVLAAFIPLDLQQSHFATVEAHHAAWVMAALAACWWLAERGSLLAAVAVGLMTGASLAVKVSSLGLLAPLAVAILLVVRRRGPSRAAACAATVAAAGVGSFWLGQPWAFAGGRPPMALVLGFAVAAALLAAAARGPYSRVAAFAGVAAAAAGGVVARTLGPRLNPAWLAGVGEQVAMVTGRADLPYVRIYRHTLPVLYPLRELGLWGLGPALLLAVLAAGVVACLWTVRRRGRWLEGRWTPGASLLLVLLAWLLPMAVRLATLQVKYLRYWEPLVVPGALLAAWWLARLRRARGLRRAVVGLTLIWGLAYLWGFAVPHPHRVAARWLDRAMSPGQAVAFETWDERLPLTVAGPRLELASYDLPDDHAKVLRWCRNLAQADWVVLTSNRVRRTVLANPDRFPRTARLYELLLSGRAGFLPLTTASRGPRLFGLRFPVQMADESFVNYDFPRVVILRRVAGVDPEALAAEVERPLPFLAGLAPGAVERKLVDPLPQIEPTMDGGAQLVGTIAWLAAFGLFAAAAWVLLLPILGGLPDAGVGLAAVSGWIGAAWLLWIGVRTGLWPSTAASTTWLFLAVVGIAGVRARQRWERLRRIWRRRRRGMAAVAGIALAVGALFLAVRAGNPAVFWGEKPMDFSFLNAFVRAPAWPPGEPWMAGMPLHYYAFGEVLAAVPIRLAGVSTAVGYNLMAASIPALAAGLLAGFGLLLAQRRRLAAAWLLPVLVLLTGNLAWPFLSGMARSGRWFDLWWATSRVIPGFAIDEYPLWTALFADLHAHFFALPVALAALAWGWQAVRGHRHWPAFRTDFLLRPRRRLPLRHFSRRRLRRASSTPRQRLGRNATLTGFSTVSRRNSVRNAGWPVAVVLLGVTMAVLAATNPWDILLVATALAVGTLSSARRPGRGIVRLSMAAGVALLAAAPFLSVLAAWLHTGVGGGGFFLTRQDFAPAWAVLLQLGVFLFPLLLGALLAAGKWLLAGLPLAGLGVVLGLGFGSPAAAVGLGCAGLFAAAVAAADSRPQRLAWTLAVVASLAVAAAERFTLIDRMNTVFKIYNGVWVLLALALGILLLRLQGRRRLALLALWLPLEAVALINLPLGIFQGWVQPRTVSPRPTLNGTAYLEGTDPETAFLVHALNAISHPGDVLAEAAGPPYREYTRIAMNTGLPTILGWEWHLRQRGQSMVEIEARKRDLATLYAGADAEARRAVLDRYRVRWIALGDVERRTYRIGRADAFSGVPGVVEIARHAGARLYLVLPVRCATIGR